MEGQIPPTVYNVVKDGEYKGEIKVGLTFNPEVLLVVKFVLFPGKDKLNESILEIKKNEPIL